jgi:hypothetical protein
VREFWAIAIGASSSKLIPAIEAMTKLGIMMFKEGVLCVMLFLVYLYLLKPAI